jgi:hypothetical protein
MGTSSVIDSSIAFPFEVPDTDSPLVVQELQIGDTRPHSDIIIVVCQQDAQCGEFEVPIGFAGGAYRNFKFKAALEINRLLELP